MIPCAIGRLLFVQLHALFPMSHVCTKYIRNDVGKTKLVIQMWPKMSFVIASFIRLGISWQQVFGQIYKKYNSTKDLILRIFTTKTSGKRMRKVLRSLIEENYKRIFNYL